MIWVRTRIQCVTCVCARSGSRCIHTGRQRQRLRRVWSVVLTCRHSYNNQSHTSLVLHERDWVFAWGDLIGWRLRWRLKLRQHHASDTPSVKRWHRRPVWMQGEPERAHTRHTPDAVRTQITWTWLCTRGKKRYKYCSFSHTNRSFRVLGHQCVVTMGNCLIWISLCMFFFPLIETVTYTCHYMTDRLERFDLKTSKLDLLKKKDTYILDALGVNW